MTIFLLKRSILCLIFVFTLLGCSGGSDNESTQNEEQEAVWDQTNWDQANWQ